uniref:Uncharacterized protein n=1 Tax=Panagrolaimus sp. JU765 TaxID=591449 RepID=A0AC34QDC5_9BILA
MVTYFSWTPVDTRNAAIATLFPAGLGLAHYMSTRPGNAHYNFYKSSIKPTWADVNPSVYGLVDLLALTPMGYATYLVYKAGGGFQFRDTTIALAIYAAHAFFFGMCLPLYEKRNYKMLAVNKGLAFLASLGTLFSYYQINDTAGMISIPFAITQGFCFYLAYKLYQLNDTRKEM